MTAIPATETAMAAEIAEQPAVLRRLFRGRAETMAAVRALVPDPLVGVALLGRGSSANALRFARYAFEHATRRPVTMVAPSMHTVYGVDVDYRGHLAIAASQSGRTPEIVDGLVQLGASGAATLAVTADPSSPLAAAAQVTVDVATGLERAVPATKTFTAELAALALAAQSCGPVPWRDGDWDAVVAAVEHVVDDPAPAWQAAVRLHDVSRIATVARGFLLTTAFEAALKLQETALVAATPWSAAAFLHGPIAAAAADFPVVAFSPGAGRAADEMAALTATLHGRGVPVVSVGPGAADLPVPGGLPEPLVAFPAAVRAQQFALALALDRGLDPDAPPGLEKVTLT